MSEYPVQLEKVQAPPLREDTLARDRLLEWLHVKVHRRVLLVLAEAGYGKTTLLADFTRRTRVRMAWYRLDGADRDWLGFLAHLVAAVRVHEPAFGPITADLIREASTGSVARDAVLETFIRELSSLSSDPAALVFDDLHLVEDSEDVRAILRALIARAPERLTFILISRSAPTLPLARMRSLGEVAELHTADLRFAPHEMEQLFRETYALNLEPAVAAELFRRTEGWAASLQLVRAAIRDRNQPEIRAFVRSLSGAEGNLYDYLAEEVVGELSAELQQFLMRTSLLEVIEPYLGSVAGAITAEDAAAAVAEAETMGLFSRLGPESRDHFRAHPLVRDFLQDRLKRSHGVETIIEIHRAIARAAEPIDWFIAGHHYLSAADYQDARRVLGSAIEAILATGTYGAAEELVTLLPSTDRPDPNVLVILSRLAQQQGQSSLGRELAESALTESRESDPVAITVLAARLATGDVEGAVNIASELADRNSSPEVAGIGEGIRLTLETSVKGTIPSAALACESALNLLRQRGGHHWIGVALSNLGYLRKAQGDAASALIAADEAIVLLTATSAGSELVSALLLRGWALAHLGQMDDARSSVRLAGETARGDQVVEVSYEAAEIEALYGDPDEALSQLVGIRDRITADTDSGEQAMLAQIHALIALGRIPEARAAASNLAFGTLRSSVAFEARRNLVLASIEILDNQPDGPALAASCQAEAEAQGALLWARVAGIFVAAREPQAFRDTVKWMIYQDVAGITMAADIVAEHLDWLDGTVLDRVSEEIRTRRDRWRSPLRRIVLTHAGPAQAIAAQHLDEIGTVEDVLLLRNVARRAKGARFPANVGRGLARRLAAPIYIEDLGRVSILVGSREINGSDIRRKVLLLVCFLLTKPRFSAARDEVLETMWPDLEPLPAQNSLNQTVYFLRRILEPQFSEDTSPGYVGQDGETIWLDSELVRSRSRDCWDLVKLASSPPDPTLVMKLAGAYAGRFALDFLYEDWAALYRDSLHAGYLRLIESALRADTDSGHYERGIALAQTAIVAEAEAEELQLALARLYRLAGSHAAASEQYQIYARSQRELGIEPEPLDRLEPLPR